ncbi:hypothetical protein [Levilactobacillus sp. N40-8-2]|uniref:hypothetical protein n=1 Tax=Levilactobacillus muriae TaxID=3238987 RepID=UPI0038B31D79
MAVATTILRLKLGNVVQPSPYRPEAFPTASGIPGRRSATIFTNLAVLIPTVAKVMCTFRLSTFNHTGKIGPDHDVAHVF